jgi:hypothetical protein
VAEAHNVYRLFVGVLAVTLVASADTGSNSPNNTAAVASSSSTAASSSTSSIATVSGSGPFSINGASLASSVPSWPVMSGDQISTGSAPALITLPDGTQLDLDPQSKVTIVIHNGIVEVIVSTGGCHERQPDPRQPNPPNHWCWVQPQATSNHRCGGGRYYDQDDRCCPGF